MIVEAIGGLCNRLRVVLSYLEAYRHVDVIWRPNGEIAGARFEDVFQPLQGVRFFSDYDESVPRTTDALPGVSWSHRLRDVFLLSRIHAIWRDMRNVYPQYDALHVRRTDLETHRKGMLPPEDEWIWWAHGQPGPVYLATDNGTTQQEYVGALDRAGVEVFYLIKIEEHPLQNESGHRNTTLADAAIDLFMCGGSRGFKGTAGSSFSDTAEMLRNLRGWWRS
jgi:hypothetical protein